MSNIEKVHLNVGGWYFETNKSTLVDKSEFFTQLLSNEEDIYFIDRDGSAFYIILNFLRQGTLHCTLEDPNMIDFLLCEAQFFKLQNLQTQLMQRRLSSFHKDAHGLEHPCSNKSHKVSIKMRHSNKHPGEN